MSATQELIAAALTAADELDELSKPMHSRMSPHAAALREACARAMVQPAAPDMAEFNKLVREFEYAAGPYGHDLRCIAARTALLDYVRGILAERDALMLEFCPQEMTEVQKEKWARNQQPVGEVPMPEQAGWAVEMHGACVLFANNAEKAAGRSPGAKTRVYTEAQALAMMRTYGEAREAAGYAAGVAAGGKDAERYRWLRDKSVPPHNFYLSVPVEFADVLYTSDQVDAAIDAALRGEVKP